MPVQPVLLIPPGMSFWQALQSGMVGPLEDKEYLAWVHTLPCCLSGVRGKTVTAHHLVGHGLKGNGTKTSDFLAIPLRFDLHVEGPNALHRIGHKEWERRHGSQLEFAARTLLEAVYRGVLRVEGEKKPGARPG